MLAMADSKGRVWGSIPGLANRARVPVDDARIAIAAFLAPDPDSRTSDHEGRRIEVIDGGWRLLNHSKYREIRDEESAKEAKRKYINTRRSEERASAEGASVVDRCRSQSIAVEHGRDNAEAEAEADAEKEQHTHAAHESETPCVVTLADCPHAEILKLFAEHLPMARQPADWTSARQAALRTRWREKRNRQNLDWWSKFFAYVAQSEFLTGKAETAGRKPFLLSLDWMLKSENFLKIIEGAYHEATA